MKKTYLTILFWCLCSATTAFAAHTSNNSEPEWTPPDVVEPQLPLEDDVAQVEVDTINHHESKEFTITIFCKDRGIKREIFRTDACFVFPAELNKKTHHLSVTYSKLMRGKKGVAICDDNYVVGFKLALKCLEP